MFTGPDHSPSPRGPNKASQTVFNIDTLSERERVPFLVRRAFEGVRLNTESKSDTLNELNDLPYFLGGLRNPSSSRETLISFAQVRLTSFQVERDSNHISKITEFRPGQMMLRNSETDRALEILDLSLPFGSDPVFSFDRSKDFDIHINPLYRDMLLRRSLCVLHDTELGGEIVSRSKDNLQIILSPKDQTHGNYLVIEIPKLNPILATRSDYLIAAKNLELLGFKELRENPDIRPILYGYEHAPDKTRKEPISSLMIFPDQGHYRDDIILGLIKTDTDNKAAFVVGINDKDPDSAELLTALNNPLSNGLNSVSAAIVPTKLSHERGYRHIYYEITGSVEELGIALYRMLEICKEP